MIPFERLESKTVKKKAKLSFSAECLPYFSLALSLIHSTAFLISLPKALPGDTQIPSSMQRDLNGGTARTDENLRVSANQNEPSLLPRCPSSRESFSGFPLWPAAPSQHTEYPALIVVDSHILCSHCMRYWCVSPTRPYEAKRNGLLKNKNFGGHCIICKRWKIYAIWRETRVWHCIIWKAIHLPVSEMLWLFKERLEYFVIITSGMGRLVRGEAVRKRKCDRILLSRWNDCKLFCNS